MTAQVIPNRFYQHEASGRKVSFYGAAPWAGENRGQWLTLQDGYSIMWPDGTVGVLPMGRKPFATPQEAQDCIDGHKAFTGFQDMGD